MRRRHGLCTAVAIVALLLTACGAGSRDSRELTVVFVNTPWARAITKHLPEFEKETGITVKLQQYAQQQARNKVFISLATGSSSPDVFNILPSNEGLKWQEAGLLQDLQGYLNHAPASYRAGDLTKTALDASRLNGHLVGIPVNVEGPVVYYRKDLLAKYDVPVPRTTKQLVAAATKIHHRSGGEYVTATRGLSPTLPYVFGNFLHNEGLQWSHHGKPTFDDPRATQAIRDYVAIAGKAGPRGVVNNGPVQNSALMASGKAAFMVDSSNELDSVAGSESKVGNRLGIIPIPRSSAGSHPTVLSWNLGMSKYSQHKSDAWRFIQWATSPQVTRKLARDGVAPPRDAPWQDPKFRAMYTTTAQRQWIDAVREIVKTGTGKVGPPVRDQDTARRLIGDEIDKVILGKETEEEAARNVQQGLQPLFDNTGG